MHWVFNNYMFLAPLHNFVHRVLNLDDSASPHTPLVDVVCKGM